MPETAMAAFRDLSMSRLAKIWRNLSGGLSMKWIVLHYGPRGTVRWILRSLPYHLWLHLSASGRRELNFDEINSVDTGGIIEPADLGIIGHAATVADVVHYAPSRPKRFLRLLEILPIDYSRFVFVDIGAGKGRALLLAAQFPFKRIIGVEFAPKLAAIARKNAEEFTPREKPKARIEVICANALEYELPPENLVIYLFNPFGGATFDRFVMKAERSLRENPRMLYFVYWSPMCEGKLAQCRSFEKIAGRRDVFAIYRAVQGSREERLGTCANGLT
jgi:SAM-dependent methyltransferase